MKFKKNDLVVLSMKIPKSLVKALERNAIRTNRYKVQVIKDGIVRELGPEDWNGQGKSKIEANI